MVVSAISAERIFQIHPKIRWAGLATDQGEVVFVKMRPGVESLSPEATDQSFIQLGPMLLSGVCERLNPWAGSLETVVVRYEKVIMIVSKIDRYYLALTVNREDDAILHEIVQEILALRQVALNPPSRK